MGLAGLAGTGSSGVRVCQPLSSLSRAQGLEDGEPALLLKERTAVGPTQAQGTVSQVVGLRAFYTADAYHVRA